MNKVEPYSGSKFDPNFCPSVTIIIPAHNEEEVIGGCIEKMLKISYPEGKLDIIVVNDRSQDNTKKIIDSYVKKHPTQLKALHRVEGDIAGKPAALKDVIEQVETEIIVIFDADYLPTPDLIRKLVQPFADEKVGATMGRVVSYNTNKNFLTKLIDLERRAGYTVELWARQHLSLFPQYGGTDGGIRVSALKDIGGWNTDALSEDTDLTCRLHLNGWKVEYLNDAECYEESPEHWSVRYKQVRRWAMGHNQCLYRFFLPILRKSLFTKKGIDALILLFVYFVPMLTFLTIATFFLSYSFVSYSTNVTTLMFINIILSVLNIAPFFQMVVSAFSDRQPHVLKVLPFVFISSFINMVATTDGFFRLVYNSLLKKQPVWDKTKRYRVKEEKKEVSS